MTNSDLWQHPRSFFSFLQQLLAVRWRVLLLLLLGVGLPLLGFEQLAWGVWRNQGGFPWDDPILQAVHATAQPTLDRVAAVLTKFGVFRGVFSVATVVSLALLSLRRWRSLTYLLITLSGSIVINRTAKEYLHRLVAQQYFSATFAQPKEWKAQQELRSEEASLHRTIDLNPSDAEAYRKLGDILSLQGKAAEAIASYQKGISLCPNDSTAYNSLGVALSGQDKTAEAIASYQKAITINPNFASAYNNLGVALSEHGKTEQAIVAYQKAISLNVNHSGTYNNFGMALYKQGKVEEAIAAYQKAISIEPNDAWAYNNLAIAASRKASSLNPNNPNYSETYNRLKGTVLR